MLVQLTLGIALVALFTLAALRPWVGLLALVGLIPFNGLLVDVIVPSLHLSSSAAVMFAAWHDALALGIVLAAGVRWLRTRPYRLRAVEIAALVVLACGAVSLAISPHKQTGLYAYRTLYEPICLAVAVAALARLGGVRPRFHPSRYAVIMFASGAVASLYAIWQVYEGGFRYLKTYFLTPGGRLPSAYVASFILQPRAIGPVHSPNEFGAFLMVVLVMAATPGLIQLRPASRAWVAAVVGFVLLLTFSRSAWVSLAGATALLMAMLPVTRARLVAFFRAPATAYWWRTFLPPLALFVVLCGGVAVSTGLSQFVAGSFSGRDPSAAAHGAQLASVLSGTGLADEPGESGTPAAHLAPFGIGLGMAGPKSARFGEVAPEDILSSETWYIVYLLQAGYVGLLALLGFGAVVTRALWGRRNVPVARAALAALGGLALGAVFIPVLDEPAVAIPLWALIGLGLGPTVARASATGDPAPAQPSAVA